MFVVVHVRQTLQQTAAIGALSPYLAAAWDTLTCQSSFFTLGV